MIKIEIETPADDGRRYIRLLTDALAGSAATITLRDDRGEVVDRREAPRTSTTSAAIHYHRLGMTVARQMLPTKGDLFPGRALAIFGDRDPAKWRGDDVAGVLNVVGTIVEGVELAGELIARNNSEGLGSCANWLHRRLSETEIPRSVATLDTWPFFVAELSSLATMRPGSAERG